MGSYPGGIGRVGSYPGGIGRVGSYPGGIGELPKCDTSVSHLVPLAVAKD